MLIKGLIIPDRFTICVVTRYLYLSSYSTIGETGDLSVIFHILADQCQPSTQMLNVDYSCRLRVFLDAGS